MKKKISLLSFLIIFTLTVFSQIDSSRILLVKYDFTILRDTTDTNSQRYTDIMLLDIKKSTTLFYSYLKQLGKKEAKDNNSLQVSGTTVIASTRTPFSNKESEYIEINYGTNVYRVYDWISKKPQYYEDSLTTPEWTLWPDTTSILNEPCQKATAFYRGRNVIAWFSKNIPVQRGPWLYNGLPGLIMKVEDDHNQFLFACRELIIKPEKEPAFEPYDNPEKISKKIAQERKRLRQEDPMASAQKEWGVAISYGDNKPRKKRPYNPIELQ